MPEPMESDGRIDKQSRQRNIEMSMQSTTIKILEAANFSSPQALALAEAIECEIKGAELVTVPVLDVRVAAIESKIRDSEIRLFNKLVTPGLTATGIVIAAVSFIVLHLKR
jgi:hypothetical protein